MVILSGMSNFFVPYMGRKPAALNVNGHRLIIIAEDRNTLESNLNVFGADSVKQLRSGDTLEEQELVFNRVARRAKSGVVIAPKDIEFNEIIKNLEHQLPWLQ